MPKVTKKEVKVTKRASKKDDGKKKRRAKKDPSAPKNALSPYIKFCEEWRTKVKAEHPDASFGELGRLLGNQWKAYTPAQKAPFIAASEKDKLRYAAEKAIYDANKANGGSDDDEEEEDEDDD